MDKISGIAQNRLGGAVVYTPKRDYWIDGMDEWDDAHANTSVVVTGTVEKREDNPVVLITNGVQAQGIPVHSKKELQQSQTRYWIVNATVQ